MQAVEEFYERVRRIWNGRMQREDAEREERRRREVEEEAAREEKPA